MIAFFTTTTGILLLLIISFNLFMLTNHGFVIGIYPYVVVTSLLFVLSLLILHFFKGILLAKIIKTLLIIISVFMLFTLNQIWRNTQLLNKYQNNRSIYMDELMRMTKDKVEKIETIGEVEEGIVNLIELNTGLPVTHYNKGKLLNGGVDTFDEMIEEISNAKEHIHVEFFILRNDRIGNKFKDVLIKKAKEGVKVRVIYDGLGSHKLGRRYIRQLREVGVEVKAHDGYLSSILKGKLNHRNHRKIVVVDGKVGFIGGFNLGDEYLGRDKNIGDWKDLQIRLEGEVVNWIQKIFLGDWYYITGEKILDKNYFPIQNDVTNFMPTQMITSGFDTHWNEISQLYFSMINSATEKIYIGTPYLILNNSMLKALQTAGLRGVDVRVIIPKKPDFFMVGWANESFFKRLLSANVKIYQYEEGFLHAKVFLVDDKMVSIGSANLNTRSLFLDYEVNAVIYDEQMANQVLQEFHLYLNKSNEVTYQDEMKKSKLQKLKQWLGKTIIPFA